jgi:hypothetical protein
MKSITKTAPAIGAVFFLPEHNPAEIGSAAVQPPGLTVDKSAILRERWSEK